ncbi:MAG: autotransporter-associated beta strand repeat-containing protein [Verrucomicrobiales bacterium]|nr:autotransporter-associated beta strand repeat-containing protein [Verrucomicrobiales bacterium]
MHSFRLFLAALFASLAFIHTALAAPDTLVQTVTKDGQTLTLRLTKQDLRGSNFGVKVQNSSGTYDNFTPVPERSYLGTVDGKPDAIASGIIQDDGVFRGAVYFDRGSTWYTLGTAVTGTSGLTQPASFNFATYTTAPGQAGSTMYGFEIGFDAEYNYFTTCAGSSVAKTLELIEYGAAITRALYMHDALLRPYLSRVIVRTSQAHDPANGKSGGGYLDAIRTDWETNHQDAPRDVVAGVSPARVGGGLAWVGVIGTSFAYSVNDSGNDGNFHAYLRHELGHNWSISHFDGGAPEGATINSSNQYARMSGPELDKVLDHRNGRLNKFTDEGTYTGVNIPPYASIDTGTVANGTFGEVAFDVLANDHDANGHALSLTTFDSTSVNGGKIIRHGDKLIFIPRGDFLGTDSFTYKIQDSSGQTATGAVTVKVQPHDRLALDLPLDETSGTSAADQSVFKRNGTLTGTDFATATVAGKFGNAVDFDGVDDAISTSGVSLDSNTVTLCGWIKREATQVNLAGILFDRSSSGHGINLTSGGELRYHWNGAQSDWASGLTPPVGVWTFVALVVEPSKATIYMNSGSGFTSAVNTTAHGSAKFSTVHVGSDPTGGRFFNGAIDDARVYGVALPQAELEKIVSGGAAEGPTPFDGATNVSFSKLTWTPSAAATSYRVYFGTSQAAVQNATTASPEYIGQVTAPEFVNPTANFASVQFWRVDVETAGGTFVGNVWKFSRKAGGPGVAPIVNHSFENGPLATGAPVGWTRTGGNANFMGVGSGGSDGARHLWMISGTQLTQDLNYYLTTGEALTLQFKSYFNAPRTIELLAKSGGSYTVLATTTATTGSTIWPTVTLNHTVAAANATKQLALRISSGGSGAENRFDNFTLSTLLPGALDSNQAPNFAGDPFTFPNAAVLGNYSGQTLAGLASDPESSPLTYAKVSGPAWLQVAPDGTLSGTPTSGNAGDNLFLVKVMDPSGARDFADLIIPVGSAQFYDINGATAGSGANSGGTWDGSAQWTASAAGSTATFAWADGGTASFSAGADATGSYTVTNSGTRVIGGLIARSGKPAITGGSLQINLAEALFHVDASSGWMDVLSPVTGSGGLFKDGPGTLVLGGSNTFTGHTTITGGTLELTPAAKLYNGGFNNNAVVTIGAGGTWRVPNFSYSGVGKLADYAARRVINGGVIEVTGAGHVSGQDFTVTTAGGIFRYTPVGQTFRLEGNGNSNIVTSGALTFDTLGNISVTGTYTPGPLPQIPGTTTSANITGSGSVVKTGSGTLTLGHGANSFAGPLIVHDGKLITSAASDGSNTALGAKSGARSIIINSGASMEWTSNNIFGGGGLSAANLPTIVLNGSTFKTTRYNVIGHLSLGGGTLINAIPVGTDSANFDGFQILGTITADGEAPSSITTTTNRGTHLRGGATTDFAVTDPIGRLTVATILRNGSNDYPGVASLRKTGPGTLALTAANVFTGMTTVAEGILTGNGTVAALTVQNGATFAPNSGASFNTGALTFESGSTFLADGRATITGDLNISGASLVTTVGSARILASYTGARSGTFTATVPPGWQLAYDDSAKQIRLEAAPTGYSGWIAGFATNGQSGFDQDANSDGIANGLVFLLGGDPTVAGSTALPVLTKTVGGFTYTFTRAARARGTTTVTARLSSDLATWPVERNIPIAPATPGVTITNLGDHDLITVTIPGTDQRTFLHLSVALP